ncbi:MAG: putative DNA binding domain-containing protein [Acidobacteria bacterium]|nr:putative DNA binding domain-containing protein [Acidobacteriota bacterium]
MTAPYAQHELEGMLADLESDLVERKESLRGDNPRKIRQAVCAFANDLPDHRRPGVVFVGADDGGAPVGLEITDELLLQLADVKTDGNIVPPPTLTVDTQVLLGTTVAVVTVMPSDTPPVRHRGRIWIRVGPRRAIASAQDERILNEKRRHRDPHFDAQPVPTASVADLDLRRFEEEYLPLAVDAAALADNDRSTEERLAALKMIAGVDDPRPTIAGILVLGKNPQDFLPAAFAQFLRIAGTDLADPVVDDGRCSGPIAHLVSGLDDKLLAHNRTAVDFTSRPVEVRTPTYPMAALQQLARNAVMHRTYEGTNAPIHVYWFDDRIEITSPGGPYGALTAENFGQPGIVDYRNQILAEAMRVLGLAQRYGAGIPTARRALLNNGQPEPDFRVEPNWVHCTVRART